MSTSLKTSTEMVM